MSGGSNFMVSLLEMYHFFHKIFSDD